MMTERDQKIATLEAQMESLNKACARYVASGVGSRSENAAAFVKLLRETKELLEESERLRD